MRRAMWAAGMAMVMGALSGAVLAAPSEDEQRAAWKDIGQAAKKGPVDVPLASEAVLHLPDGEVFVPQPQATRVLQLMGNPGDHAEILGIIMPRDPKADWFMPVRFEAAGYVKDDDAKHWDADEMLKSFRDGATESNKERAKAGIPEMEIVGWAQPPKYDAAQQRLVWALASRDVGAPADAGQGVNYNTYALGRDGYFSMNLVASLRELEALKPVAAQQLAALDYNPGKHYADFDAKTDHVAEYGLAALVVGVAAKKLGLIALGAAFFAKFAKIILIALAAFGGGFLKIFRRKPKPVPAPARADVDVDEPTRAHLPAPAPAPARELPPLEMDAEPPAPHGADGFPATTPMPLDGPATGHGPANAA